MNGINSISAYSNLSSSRVSNTTGTQNSKVTNTSQKSSFLQPNADPEAKTYLAKKSRIEATPMKENISIAIDVVA